MIIASCHWYGVFFSLQSDSQQQSWASLGGGAGLAYVFVNLLPDIDVAPFELFCRTNYLYAHSLPSLIGTGRAYGILFTVAVLSHSLLSDRFSVIHHPK